MNRGTFGFDRGLKVPVIGTIIVRTEMSLQALTANRVFLFETQGSEAININKMLVFSVNMVTIFYLLRRHHKQRIFD